MPPFVQFERKPDRLLVVLPTWVGDFVMATPTLRSIRKRFSESRIAFLLEPNLRDLVRGGRWMDQTLEWPPKPQQAPWSRAFRRLVAQIRAAQFDAAVLLPNSFRSAFTVWAAGIPKRIGYDRDGRGFLLTDRIPLKNRWECRDPVLNGRPSSPSTATNPSTPGVHQQQGAPLGEDRGAAFRWYGRDCGCDMRPFGPHAPVIVGRHLPKGPGRFIPMPMVHYYADLAEALGCDRPDDQLELFTTPDCDESITARLSGHGLATHRPLVVIAPGAKFGAAKCWPAERFALTADALIEKHDARVVLTCGPGEEPIAREIRSRMRHPGVFFEDPLLTLGELKSLIARSDLLVCNDAGLRHFAKAFGVPVVTIFGPTHPDWTATSYERERIVRVNLDCGPCQQRICPLGHHLCMNDVTAEMVLAACRDLLHEKACGGALVR